MATDVARQDTDLPDAATPDPARRETEERLVARYAEQGVDPDEVRGAAAAAWARLAEARISAFVPVLVERAVL